MNLRSCAWRWCLNAFEDPDDVDFPRTADDPRVLRGGAWHDDPGFARVASRRRLHPGNRGDDVGFRLCVSSPIPER